MAGPRYAVEDLNESTCRRLLSTAPAGRVGFTARALPRILPVYCRTRGEEIVVASLHGTEVLAPRTGEIVAFEVDSCDPATREGWCVGVIGACRVIAEEAEIAHLDGLDLAPWTSVQGGHYFGIRIGLIQGRTLTRRRDRMPMPQS